MGRYAKRPIYSLYDSFGWAFIKINGGARGVQVPRRGTAVAPMSEADKGQLSGGTAPYPTFKSLLFLAIHRIYGYPLL